MLGHVDPNWVVILADVRNMTATILFVHLYTDLRAIASLHFDVHEVLVLVNAGWNSQRS